MPLGTTINILATDVPLGRALPPFPHWRLLSNRYAASSVGGIALHSADGAKGIAYREGPPVFTTRTDADGPRRLATAQRIIRIAANHPKPTPMARASGVQPN